LDVSDFFSTRTSNSAVRGASAGCCAEEPGGVAAQIGPQNLDGQIALEGVIAAAVDLAHATDADALKQRMPGRIGALRRAGVRR
jgi:hypothetical protein